MFLSLKKPHQVGYSEILVQISQITHIYTSGKDTIVVTTGGKISVSDSLSSIHNMLELCNSGTVRDPKN